MGTIYFHFYDLIFYIQLSNAIWGHIMSNGQLKHFRYAPERYIVQRNFAQNVIRAEC